LTVGTSIVGGNGGYFINGTTAQINASAAITGGTAPFSFAWSGSGSGNSWPLTGGLLNGSTASRTVPGIARGNTGTNTTVSWTVTCTVTDSLGMVASSSSTKTVTFNSNGSSQPASYVWSPTSFATGQTHYLTITNAIPNAAVSAFSVFSDQTTSGSYIPLGTTNASGNFSTSSVAQWGAGQTGATYYLAINGTIVSTTVVHKI
jgi:hypothetical protein